MALTPDVAGELERIANHVPANAPAILPDGTKINTGAIKLCKTCNRRHGRREGCKMFLRTRTLPNGEQTKRWTT